MAKVLMLPILLWTACLVAITTSIPLFSSDDQSLSNSNWTANSTASLGDSTDFLILTPKVKLKSTESIHILYGLWEDINYWFIYKGPQGIAVEPCKLREEDPALRSPFVRLYSVIDPYWGDIHRPPRFPEDAKWSVPVADYKDCFVFGEKHEPGQLRCGDYLIYDFQKDPQYNDPTDTCEGSGIYFHRAWMVEF